MKVHFCGIGGVAMSAAARLAVELGHEVRGSDNPLYPPASHMVASLGVPVASSYDESNLDWQPDVVVIGNALSRGNAEIEAILERRLFFKSMPEWLKEEVLRYRQPIVICGTHGKTTTTTLTAHLLDRAGLQPGFLIGGQPLDFPHAARLGKESAPFVIEGDEYDTAFFDKRAKFFHYLPQIAVVTSLEFDHGDIYPNVEAIEQAFRLMLRQIPRNGRLILCAEAPRALALASHAFCPVVTYGFQPGADYRGQWESSKTQDTRLRVTKEGKDYGVFDLPLWGNHNALNVLAALAVADQYGVEVSALQLALRDFKGVRRRMEVFLEARGAVFIDDFAHHPTAIRETVAAVRLRFPKGRLRVLCEPRSNTMVTNRFQDELIEALSGADEVWLGAVYRAESIPPETRLDREAVRAALENRGVAAYVENTAEEIAGAVWETLQAGDVVLVLSNGAFGGIYEFFRKMAKN
ncbi:MAG TPA: Mur ligase family protein [Candidatus Hydrogenedentes bacterium]|nr:Mur ligase family protein [Candidatus Hydrogenedentota bacterium]HOL76028.1 Mur ligase family protein [Candidatus Hydrogenedentota bacterium]HPO84642.1 Mur ligase family protein [Candidatus Hydrogenedentota bacterium]